LAAAAGLNFLLFGLFQLRFLRPVVFTQSVAVPAGAASKASFFSLGQILQRCAQAPVDLRFIFIT
jgi:hypothetical protein